MIMDTLESDVIILICSYLTPPDLMMAAVVSKQWRDAQESAWQDLAGTIPFRYLTFKRSYKFSPKEICNISYGEVKSPFASSNNGILITTGGYGTTQAVTVKSVLMEDSLQLKGHHFAHGYLSDSIGSAAGCMDSRGRCLLLGGWDDDTELSSSLLLRFDPHNSDEKLGGWQSLTILPSNQCYGAATTTIDGSIYLLGGGSTPYRRATVFDDVSVLVAGDYDRIVAGDDSAIRSLWRTMPSMLQQRCGHSAVTTFDDSIVVFGGYSGGTSYLASGEIMHSGAERWIKLPPMSSPRSGFGGVLGWCGSIYAAGGSCDGTHGLKSFERLDLREGKWHEMPEMHCERGYAAACMGKCGRFFVSGGIHKQAFAESMECFDPRANRWTLMQPPDGVVDDADHDGADAGVAVGGFGEHDNENNDEDDDDEGEGDGDGAAVAAASAAGVVLSAVDETVARAGLRTDRDQARPLGSRSLAMHLRRASHQMFPIL